MYLELVNLYLGFQPKYVLFIASGLPILQTDIS